WRWCRRNPVVASLETALTLAIGVGFASVIWELHRVSEEEATSRRNLYTSDMNRVFQAWREGSLPRAQALLQAHRPQAAKEDLRGFEYRYLWQLCQDESRFTFTNIHFAPKSLVARHGLALAADGCTLIAASGSTLKWLDCQKQREVKTLSVGIQA